MAYPTVSAPYGLKPVNLIGGQVFAGSTRNFPIPYNYGTAIYYGDIVAIARGFVAPFAGTTTMNSQIITGVFLGCYYTNPTTKQRQYTQYYPGNVLAGDITAIVADDPDTVFQAAVCPASSTTVTSASYAMVGQNAPVVQNTGSANTGNSAVAVQSQASVAANTAYALRIVGIVPDTAVALGTAVYSSISTATITTTANVAFAVPVGTDVAWLAPNGSLVETGSFVATAITANNTTSVVLNTAPQQTIGAAATLVFTQYPEVLVKINFGNHQYYTGTGT
jgi:hypothetical protein